MKPYSSKIFMPDGNPDGLRVIDLGDRWLPLLSTAVEK